MSLSQAEAQSVTWQSDRSAFQKLKSYAWRLTQWMCALLLPMLILCLWWLAAHQKWLPEQILPAPLLVWQTSVELWQSGELQFHFQVSASRILWSMLLGTAAGILIGVGLALAKRSRDYVLPWIQLIAQFPLVGWIPLLMIFLGIDEELKIVAIALAVFPAVLVATYKGILGVPTHLLEVAQVYQFSTFKRFKDIVIPSALPEIVGGIRQGMMQAWLALVFVELLASSEGIGFLMVWGRQLMQMDIIFMAIVLIGVTGYVLDAVFAQFERLARFYVTRKGADHA